MQNNPNTGYLCFLIVAKFLGTKIPQEYENRFTDCEDADYELIRTAKELGFKVSAGKIRIKKIEKTTIPTIAKLKDGSYLLLVNHQKDKWVILNPLKGTPETIDEVSLFDMLTGWVIIGKKKTDSENNGNQKFGFRWFMPTIFKFKKQFICVLIVVFVI